MRVRWTVLIVIVHAREDMLHGAMIADSNVLCGRCKGAARSESWGYVCVLRAAGLSLIHI